MKRSLPEMMELAEAQARHWKLGELRPGQIRVLEQLAQMKSTIGSLPTGYGKSACFQIPASAWGWKVWIVSPLLALMADQARSARERGLRTLCWLPTESRKELENSLRDATWDLCFLSPERYADWFEAGFVQACWSAGIGPDLIVLDEMHCLEEWRDFRDGYFRLGALLRQAPSSVPILGLSASFSPSAVREWAVELERDFALVETGLGRENVHLQVLPIGAGEEAYFHLCAALRGLSAPDCAIVYCFSRREADELARWLRSFGCDAVSFHAGLPREERAARVQSFRQGNLRIVCATTAFGMGIDYPRVRKVIHFSMPADWSSYWQEAGRAGRDGRAAEALLLWKRSDVFRARLLSGDRKRRFEQLWRGLGRGGCLKGKVAAALGKEEETSCGSCSPCLRESCGAEPRAAAWWTADAKQLSRWIDRHFAEK